MLFRSVSQYLLYLHNQCNLIGRYALPYPERNEPGWTHQNLDRLAQCCLFNPELEIRLENLKGVSDYRIVFGGGTRFVSHATVTAKLGSSNFTANCHVCSYCGSSFDGTKGLLWSDEHSTHFRSKSAWILITENTCNGPHSWEIGRAHV